MTMKPAAIWFPTIRTGTGTDVFTERLVAELSARRVRAEIAWLPLRAEYAPWAVPIPQPPSWATVCHINTWLHPRFIPRHLPVVATLHHAIHDPALRSYKGWMRAVYHRWWIAPIERRVFRQADKVVSVSRFAADMARQSLCDVPIRVIYSGIDTELFRPATRVRQRGEPFRLLYVGGWTKCKGVDLLAPIMRVLGKDFELHYTGGSRANKHKAGMPANMHDLGRLTCMQVICAMQNSDALLFPSRSEGFGLVVAEAMACGLPVIATKGMSVDEVVADGKTGFLCVRDDVQAFASAAQEMAGNQRTYMETRTASREVAVTRFQISQMVDAYFRTYRDVLGDRT